MPSPTAAAGREQCGHCGKRAWGASRRDRASVPRERMLAGEGGALRPRPLLCGPVISAWSPLAVILLLQTISESLCSESVHRDIWATARGCHFHSMDPGGTGSMRWVELGHLRVDGQDQAFGRVDGNLRDDTHGALSRSSMRAHPPQVSASHRQALLSSTRALMGGLGGPQLAPC